MSHDDTEDADRTLPTPGRRPEPDDMRTRPMPARARPESSPENADRITDETRPADAQVIADKYVVVRHLAEGGFGVVYEGYYTINGNRIRVAIKLMRASKQLDHMTMVRFNEEVRTLCQLQHPNICRVIDGGIENGTDKRFLVMDFADGGTLKHELKKSPDQRIDPATAIEWLEQAAIGLLAAERNVDENGRPAPIFHRDVKPENLLLQQGRVVVADFGAARLGGDFEGVTNAVVPALWTPAYGSPEQSGGTADHRSDIYALGTTFFHLLTGRTTSDGLLHKSERFDVAHDPSDHVETVPRALGAIIKRMTAPQPADRYQSFEEVLADVAELKVQPAPKWPKAVLVVLAAAVLVLVGLQLSGVNLFGVGVQASDRAAGEVLAEVQDLQRKHAGLLQQSLELFPELQQRRRKLSEDINAAVVSLQELVDTEGEAVRALPATFGGVTDLRERYGYLEKRLPEHVQVREQLRAIGDDVAVTAVDTLRLRMDGLSQALASLLDGGELRRLAGAIRVRIDAAASQRTKQLQDVQDRFDEGRHDGLVAVASSCSEELRRCGETSMAERAAALATYAEEAQRLLRQLPGWSPVDEDLLGALPQLRDALTAWDAAKGGLRGELVTWFDRQLATRHVAWVTRAADAFDAAKGALEVDAKQYNELSDPAGNAELVAARSAEYGRLQQRLDVLQEAAESLVGLSSLMADVDTTRRLARLRAPSVELRVAEAPADLSSYEGMLASADYRIDPGSFADALRGPADAVVVARGELAAAVAGARGVRSPDFVALGRLGNQLSDRRALLDAAAAALTRWDAAEAALAATACSQLRKAVEPDLRLLAIEPLERRRRQLVAKVEAQWQQREQKVRSLETSLVAVDDVSSIASRARSVAKELDAISEQELGRRAARVVAAADGIRGLEVPAWQPGVADSFDARIARFDGYFVAAARLAAFDPGKRGDLIEKWWQGRRDRLAGVWGKRAASDWAKLLALTTEIASNAPQVDGPPRQMASEQLRRYASVDRKLRELARQQLHRELLLGGPLGESLPQLPPLVVVEGGGEPYQPPPNWAEPGFEAPPGLESKLVTSDDAEFRRIYSAEFLAWAEKQDGGLRLWFFPDRKDDEGRQVYMALVKSPDGKRAELIDVMPVTFGEGQQCGEFSREYLRGGREVREHPMSTLLYDTSSFLAAKFAKDVGEKVGGDIEFDLPPPEFVSWLRSYGNPVAIPVPKPNFYPRIAPGADVTEQGLVMTRSGVSEWVRRVGEERRNRRIEKSEIVARTGDRRRFQDAGFRMAIALRIRPQ